jgi:hypothetical protein
MLIETTKGMLDDSLLLLKVVEVDDDNEHTISTEYCLMNCPGEAHMTGEPDASGYFCCLHVHRSVTMQLKKWPAIQGGLASFDS